MKQFYLFLTLSLIGTLGIALVHIMTSIACRRIATRPIFEWQEKHKEKYRYYACQLKIPGVYVSATTLNISFSFLICFLMLLIGIRKDNFVMF